MEVRHFRLVFFELKFSMTNRDMLGSLLKEDRSLVTVYGGPLTAVNMDRRPGALSDKCITRWQLL